MEPYVISEPKGNTVPVLVSVPHSGTEFPSGIFESFHPDLAKAPDDTDWYVDQLYEFTKDMGITLIRATYSRWLIDLNRDIDNGALYDDGRILTALCPLTDFFGRKLYVSATPDKKEIALRVERYYLPYYRKVQEVLDDLKKRHGKVLLWDAHSIRRKVPTISSEPFPDLILGSVGGTSCHQRIIESVLDRLKKSQFTATHNHPFKGGQITRSFGKPEKNQNALQLELSKDLYLDMENMTLDRNKSKPLESLLKTTFEEILIALESL